MRVLALIALCGCASASVAPRSSSSLRAEAERSGREDAAGLTTPPAAERASAGASRARGATASPAPNEASAGPVASTEPAGESVGALDRNPVIEAIHREQRAFRRCYEHALVRDARVQGRISVQFTVYPDGRFGSARPAENTTGDDALAACVVGVIGSIRLAEGPVGGPVSFVYPLVFAPQR